jgi:hypothetical protein
MRTFKASAIANFIETARRIEMFAPISEEAYSVFERCGYRLATRKRVKTAARL